MASQPVERRRCLSCNRWAGARTPGPEPDTVAYDEDNDRGDCQDGPWHGTSRRGLHAPPTRPCPGAPPPDIDSTTRRAALGPAPDETP